MKRRSGSMGGRTSTSMYRRPVQTMAPLSLWRRRRGSTGSSGSRSAVIRPVRRGDGMTYAARYQTIEQRLKDLIQAYQATQAQVQQTQQEIFKLQGQLELLRELADEEAKLVH